MFVAGSITVAVHSKSKPSHPGSTGWSADENGGVFEPLFPP
jgi:hypothetical protein